MIKIKMLVISTVLIALSCLFLVLGFDKADTAVLTNEQHEDLRVKLSPLKVSYIQGEVVVLDLEIANKGASDVFLQGADAQSGYLKLFVATDDQKFKQYSHSAWGRTTKGMMIKANQIIESRASMLWNFSPIGRFTDLSSFKDSHIMSDFAFRETGVYFIKAVLIIPGEPQKRIESAPVQIVINEPIGDDLKVWDKIKNNGEIAYFIQQGEIRAYKPEERKKLVNEVEQLVVNNPSSFLASQIGESLAKFRVSDAKLKEAMDKLRQQQKPSN